MIHNVIYLAAPYQHNDPQVQIMRFNAINRAAAMLMRNGVFIFSPISHTHPIAQAGALPADWGFWQAYDTAMLDRCDGMIVLMLDGWLTSRGVTAELEYAKTKHWGVTFLSERDIQ